MHPCPFPAAFSSVMLMLVLVTVLASSTTHAIDKMSCAPAACGSLNITYPFWLSGTHQPYCGFRAFEVTCDKGNASLGNAFWTYQILDIWYQNSSFRVAHDDASLPAEARGRCWFELTFNASSDLALSPFTISPRNQELVFLYNCTKPPRSPNYSPVNCSGYSTSTSVSLTSEYNPDDRWKVFPGFNCNVSLIPVVGLEGASAADYERLMKGGFLLEYTVEDCTECTDSGGRWRVNITEDVFECHCPDGVYPLVCGSKGNKRIGVRILLIVLAAAAASLLFPCIYVLMWHRKGKKLRCLLCTETSSNTETNIEGLIVSYGSLAPKRYKYSEVTNITTFLNNKLGEGGYGVVFKGRLHDGRLVAVKLLHDSKGKGEEFVNEVMSIGRTSHVNIVSLFGFCLEGSKRALIYEYMSNGSLDKYIYSENPKEILGWEKLYTIAIGIARGLEYLHHSCNTRIVHFDIKPQNILLDQDFCPKIADFGLAKLCRTKESKLSMTGARGTIGFIAPEVHSRTFGVVSTKSDVYSYGMMLLEMVGGRKNVKSMVEKSSEKYFPDWIYDHFAQDDGLQACEVASEFEQIAKKMTFIGLWCVQVLPMHRPTTTQVLDMFERGVDELDMPPKQNFYEIFEDSAHNLNAESTSSTSPAKAQSLGEVLKVEEISLVNSKILKRLPTL